MLVGIPTSIVLLATTNVVVPHAFYLIAFGVAVMVWPSATVNVVAFLVGALLVGFGLVLLWFGRQLSRLADVA